MTSRGVPKTIVMPIKIERSGDCGNSPKQQFLQDFVIAIATADLDQLAQKSAPDISWLRAGHTTRTGQDQFLDAVRDLAPVEQIVIHDVVSHGRKGAVRGTIRSQGESRLFSQFVEFANTKCTHVRLLNTLSEKL